MTKSCIEKPADNESTTGGLNEPLTLTQTLSVSSAPSIQLSESNIGLDFTPSGAEFINSDNRVTYGIADIGTQMNYFWRERGTSNTMMFLSETNNLQVVEGTNTNPSYTFLADSDTGLYRSGVNQLGLTAGGIGVMNLTSTGWNSSVQPRFYVKPAATLGFSVPTSTDQLLPGSFWGTPDYSVGYTSFTNGILTIAEDGYYVVSFNVTFNANGSGGRIARVNNLTTGEFLSYQSVAPSPGSLSTNLAGTWVGFLSAGDQLQPLVRQDSGINLTIGIPTRNSFSVFKLY